MTLSNKVFSFRQKKFQLRLGFSVDPEHPRAVAASFAGQIAGKDNGRGRVCTGASEGRSFRFCFGPVAASAGEAGGWGLGSPLGMESALMFSDGPDGGSSRLCGP